MKTLFTKPIIIQLKPSLLLLGLLLAVATISSAIVLVVSIMLAIKLVLLGLIIASTFYYIARDALLVLPWSWQTVEVDTKGVMMLINKRQQRIKPQLAATTFVHEYCVILKVKYQGFELTPSPVLLFKNGDNRDALRRLRVWLRLYENKKDRKIHQSAIQLTTLN